MVDGALIHRLLVARFIIERTDRSVRAMNERIVVSQRRLGASLALLARVGDELWSA